MSIFEATAKSSRDVGVTSIAKSADDPDFCRDSVPEISVSFGNLAVAEHDTLNSITSPQTIANGTNPILATSTTFNQTNGTAHVSAPNGDCFSSASDRSSPAILVSSEPHEPFSHQLQNVLCDPVDQPDPRLVDALENPRDRIFVIKLEKDLVAFVEDKSCEIFDMPPINSYHRLLAHKMAEYYRLTHVADSSGASVRMFRGQAARIPATLLSAWPVAQQLQKAGSTGAVPAVKIMRRGDSDKGSETPPGETSTPRKDGSETSSENDNSNTASYSTKNTREERAAAYQEARARIFKDFVESPPDTPPPGKEKSRKQEKHDDFSGRSQFYPVHPHPTHPTQFYPQTGYHDSQMLPVMPQQTPPAQRFNPTANFTPSSQFTPSPQPFSGPPSSRSYPSFNNTRDRVYPPAHQSQLTVFPPRNGVYQPQPAAINGTVCGNFNSYSQPSAMSTPYNPGGYPQHGHHGMQQHHFNQNGSSPSLGRQSQPQSQQQSQSHFPMHHHQPYGAPPNMTSQRMPGQFGWGSPNGVPGQLNMTGGGVAMPRSSSAPGYPGTVDSSVSMGNSGAYGGGNGGLGGGGGGAGNGVTGIGGWGGPAHQGWTGNTAPAAVSGMGRGTVPGMGGMNMRM